MGFEGGEKLRCLLAGLAIDERLGQEQTAGALNTAPPSLLASPLSTGSMLRMYRDNRMTLSRGLGVARGTV